MTSQLVFSLGLFAVGLITGVITLALVNRHRIQDALAARTRDLEVAHQQAGNEWALRQAELQHELTHLRNQQQELRQRQEKLQADYETAQHTLRDSERALAGAREQLQFLSDVREQLQARDATLSRVRAEQTELQTRLEEERKRFTEQLALLQSARTDLTREFENLANKIFENKQQQFSLNSKSLLETTLDPFRNQLQEFRRKVEDVYEKENSERSRLAGQIVELQKQAQKIGEDAVNLAQALKGNSKSQGNWGEVVLERLLEQSGLQKGREYETQLSFTNEDGSRRMPDVIVRLPENKDIVIDAKVSLVDYEKFCNSDDQEERQRYLSQHIQSLRSHIRNLSIKDYEKLEGVRALDFVFIFVPIEAAFMLALQHEPELYREAYDRHIILASPTTLLAILRTVENIWRYEKQNRNAEKIAKEAGALHDQFVLLLQALDQIGNHIDKTREAYDTARKRLATGRGNLLKRVDDIRRLGAKTKKQIERERLEDADNLEDETLLALTDDDAEIDDADLQDADQRGDDRQDGRQDD